MDKIEPKFFLQDELIYFLKKNMSMIISPVVSGDSIRLHAQIFICQQPITSSDSVFNLPTPSLIGGMSPLKMEQTIIEQQTKMSILQNDVYMLTQHMHNQEKEINDLKKSLVSG